MRIGVDLRPLLTGKISGIEQYTISVLKELIKKSNHTYVLFYVSYKDQDKILVDLIEKFPILTSPNVEIRKLKWSNLSLSLHLMFKSFDWPKADIVCGGLDVMWMPSPRLLPLSKKCAKVTTFHDLIFLLFPQFYSLSSRLWQWQMGYPFEARTSDALISISQNTKRDMVKLLKTDPGKIHVIYEGVDKEYFQTPNENLFSNLKNKWQLPDKYIYFVGSIEPRKNLITVVRALHQFKQTNGDTIKLVVSGGKSWMTTELYKTIQDLGLAEEVIFTGPVLEAEKISLMQHAFVFTFPSFYEGFGLMILEAFACGCPVICSNVSSLPEVAGDAAILISSTDVNGLVDAIEKMLTNPTLRENLTAKGKVIARQLDWETTAQKTLLVLEEAKKNNAKQVLQRKTQS